MDDKQKEEVFKVGMGAVSQVSEYAAKGMNNPKAVEITKSVTDYVKDYDHTAKLGADAVKWVVGAAGAVGTAGATGTLATAAATVAPLLPVAVGAAAVYGLYKIAENILED